MTRKPLLSLFSLFFISGLFGACGLIKINEDEASPKIEDFQDRGSSAREDEYIYKGKWGSLLSQVVGDNARADLRKNGWDVPRRPRDASESADEMIEISTRPEAPLVAEKWDGRVYQLEEGNPEDTKKEIALLKQIPNRKMGEEMKCESIPAHVAFENGQTREIEPARVVCS